MVMRYIGDGAALIGVPARDLSADEVAQYGADLLRRSRLYEDDEQEQEQNDGDWPQGTEKVTTGLGE
jgi:hypothetical protein